MASYALAIAAMVVVLAAWVGVQIAWRKAFPGVGCDPDVLAIRMGCSGCKCQEEDAGDQENARDGTVAPRKSDRNSIKGNVPGSVEEEIS